MLGAVLGEVEDVVALGAHADDIEIGCAATLLTIARSSPGGRFSFAIASTTGTRADEARASASALLEGRESVVHVEEFEDGFLPYSDPGEVKRWLKELYSGTTSLVRSHPGTIVIGTASAGKQRAFFGQAVRGGAAAAGECFLPSAAMCSRMRCAAASCGSRPA